ncbi:MAG: hypothetical protein IJ741_05695 [Schwartzia sp.]|nr:hypothetical protein [Schwartzia sp. (in: firmicutes)]
MQMFVSVSTCASNGDAFFFRRNRRELLPIGCSLLDLRELEMETGISMDDVLSRLDDFDSADALLGFGPVPGAPILRAEQGLSPQTVGAPFFTEPPVSRSEFIRTETQAPDAPMKSADEDSVIYRPFFGETSTPQETSVSMEPVSEPIIEPMIEPRSESRAARPEETPRAEIEEMGIEAQSGPARETMQAEAPPIVEAEEIVIEAQSEPIMEPARTEEPPVAEAGEIVVEMPDTPPAEKAGTARASVAEASTGIAPARRSPSRAASRLLRRNLEDLRKWATVRVEAAEPEEEAGDETLIQMKVPEGYVVQTTTESIVWPWEVRENLTLKEALEAIDDRALTSLTEEVVSCTISGQLGEGGVKSLCETYGKEKEQIYSAIQHESRRRITRMNAKPRAATGTASDATMEMAMRMAKQFLQAEMGKNKATRFESTFPSEDGNYYIFQKHRVEDEDSVEFPNERVYYRETGDGWAISVGY